MATGQMNRVIQHLRRSTLLRDGAGLTDGQLLGCFIDRQDEAAFEALVRRHGPMVLGVCRRVLGNVHDAEDAFQATFLLLVRKAASLESRELVGNWLYGVAYRTALDARGASARRRSKERQVSVIPEEAAPVADVKHELLALLDQELARLPDKFRVPVVLCDLEGSTRKEVARQLGIPEGTLSGRLTTARRTLAKRLASRGLTLSGGALAAALSQSTALACVPMSLVRSTAKAATAVAAGGAAASVVSAKVAALIEGVLKAMFLTKLKMATPVILVVAAVLSAGASIWPDLVLGDEQPQPAKTAKPATNGEGKLESQPKPVVVRQDAIFDELAWSPDGKIVATVAVTYEPIEVGKGEAKEKALATNSTVKLWDAKTGKLKRSLSEEKHTRFSAIAFSSDGKTAAIAVAKIKEEGTSYEVRLVDAETWEPKRKVEVNGFVNALTFSADGKLLALGGTSSLVENGSFVKVWEVQKQKLLWPTKENEPKDGDVKARPDAQPAQPDVGCVFCLSFSPDGKMVAAADKDGKVRLFDSQTGGLKHELAGHSESVRVVAFAADGKTLASGSGDQTVKLWDAQTGKLRETLKGSKAWGSAVAFAPDGKLLGTGGEIKDDKLTVEVIRRDAQGAELKQVFPDPVLGQWTRFAFAPDGKTLAIGAGSGGSLQDHRTTGQLMLWRLESQATNKK